jgi:menaquinone-dependent protoporphyrinogen oxidase
MMNPVLVLYATRQGQARRIAEYLTAALGMRHLAAELVDAAHIPAGFSLENYSAAMVCASVHRGRHEKEMIAFVQHHKADLERIPAIFLSVSLSEAGAEDLNAPPAQRGQAASDVRKMMGDFFAETGWHPAKTQAVAGALRYTKYNRLLRFVMKRIAERAGASADTSCDHEFTDWPKLDQLVDELAQELVAPAVQAL